MYCFIQELLIGGKRPLLLEAENCVKVNLTPAGYEEFLSVLFCFVLLLNCNLKILKLYNKSFIDQACLVKMTGFWPRSSSFFLFFFSPRSIKTRKKNLANTQPYGFLLFFFFFFW